MSIDQVHSVRTAPNSGKAAAVQAGGAAGFDQAMLAALLGGDGTLEGALDATLAAGAPDAADGTATPAPTKPGKKDAAAADPLAAAMAALLIPTAAPIQQPVVRQPGDATVSAVAGNGGTPDPSAALVAKLTATSGMDTAATADPAKDADDDKAPVVSQAAADAKAARQAKPLPLNILPQPGAADPVQAGLVPAPLGRMAPRAAAAPAAARDQEVRPAGAKPAQPASPPEQASPRPVQVEPTAAHPTVAPVATAAGVAEGLAEKPAAASAGAGEKAADSLAVPTDPALAVAAPMHAARADAAAATSPIEMKHPAEQIAVSVRQAAHEGVNEITVELRPANLGAVEVKLDFGTDGRVSAAVMADRPETLSLLKSDAGGLEQALRDAGLQADPGSLSFSLRGDQSQPDPRQFQQQTAQQQRARDAFASTDDTADLGTVGAAPVTRRSHAGLLDIRI